MSLTTGVPLAYNNAADPVAAQMKALAAAAAQLRAEGSGAKIDMEQYLSSKGAMIVNGEAFTTQAPKP